VILKERLVVVDDEEDEEEEALTPKSGARALFAFCQSNQGNSFAVVVSSKEPDQLADKKRLLCRDCV